MVVASTLTLLVGLALPTWATAAKPPPRCSSKFPASGQTFQYTADKTNDFPVGPVVVADDGTVQAGATLSYQDNGNGTITDLNTGLMWEKKDATFGLHGQFLLRHWSGNGIGNLTIWDWLDDVNAEGGTGFAGHNDWRIPNVKELQSIVDYGVSNPSIDSLFANTEPLFPYWLSSTIDLAPTFAWFVSFADGHVDGGSKSDANSVRAVRGGCS